MRPTFGEQALLFAKAIDTIDQEGFMFFRGIVEEYTRKTLDISMTRLMVESTDHKTLYPYGLALMGEVQPIPIRDANGEYGGQTTYAYDRGKALWIVSADKKEQKLQEASSYQDLWSNEADLPPYRVPLEAKSVDRTAEAIQKSAEPMQTSIIIPLRYANNRIFGVAVFETEERLDKTEVAQRELQRIADALSICYRVLRDTHTRKRRTVEALDVLRHDLAQTPVKLTKPNVFFSSSKRAKQDVVNTIIQIFKEKAFKNTFNLIHWEDITEPGNINEQVLKKLSRCRFGVCYLSEETEEQDCSFQDNVNVVFEAGMLHGRSDLSSPVPASWIPIREINSPTVPFNYASERILLVQRTAEGDLKSREFKEEFRKRLLALKNIKIE